MLLDSIVDINMFILDLFAKVVSTSTVCSNTILFPPDLSKPWAHQKATIWRSVAGDCCSSDIKFTQSCFIDKNIPVLSSARGL